MQPVMIGQTINALDGREIIRKLHSTVHETVNLIGLLTLKEIALLIGKTRTDITEDLVHGVVNLVVREPHFVHVLFLPAHHFFQMLCLNHLSHLPSTTYANGRYVQKTQGTTRRTSAKA